MPFTKVNSGNPLVKPSVLKVSPYSILSLAINLVR